MSQLPEWARAHGSVLFSGRIRSVPEDFAVRENLDVDFAGQGEHDWLRIEKIGANTAWVAGLLAKHARVPLRDVGYAGLKDRHAVTTQWFSVRRQIKAPTDWDNFEAADINVLERQVHDRKLKRGMHRGNTFRIAVRSDAVRGLRSEIDGRLRLISAMGVPNYFGEQRFGRDGNNVELGRAVLGGKRMPRNKRSIGISALRSFEFNRELDRRVLDGTWNRFVAGDVANLDGTNSTFVVDDVTAEIVQRCAGMDIHPAGLLPAYETIRVAASHRALRMRVADASWELTDDTLWLDFRLGRGGYATAVLREIAST